TSRIEMLTRGWIGQGSITANGSTATPSGCVAARVVTPLRLRVGARDRHDAAGPIDPGPRSRRTPPGCRRDGSANGFDLQAPQGGRSLAPAHAAQRDEGESGALPSRGTMSPPVALRDAAWEWERRTWLGREIDQRNEVGGGFRAA